MTSDAPGPSTPDSGQPPEDEATRPVNPGQWPSELVPPPAAPAAPASPAPASSGTWGTTTSSGTWNASPSPAPAQPAQPEAQPAPAAPAQWGAAPAPQPQPAAQPAPQWGAAPAPAPQPAPQPAPAPQWGAAAPVQPAPQPAPQAAPQWGAPAAAQTPPGGTPPPAGPGWGAPPAGAPQAQPGQWGAPPQQGGYPGGYPQGGYPGGGTPPPGAWNPQPAKSGNGCLKACLIVGGILVVLAILAVIALTVFANKFVNDIGINGDGSIKQCELIAQGDLTAILGSDAQALPIGGIADATVGQLLDKRILKDAPDCWAFAGSDQKTSITGRLARQDGGDASGEFAKAKADAQAGGYLDTTNTVSGLGDEAFCTTIGEMGSAGVLVRAGGRLVYVSLLDPTSFTGDSSNACKLSQQLAAKMLSH